MLRNSSNRVYIYKSTFIVHQQYKQRTNIDTNILKIELFVFWYESCDKRV